MKRDALRKLLGETATDELVDSIMALYGQSVDKLNTDLGVATTKVADLQKQLTDANTTIDGFKKMDVESIQKSAADWEAKYKQATADGETRIAELKMDFALKAALTSQFKARDPQDIIPHIKRESIKLGEDGKLIGLEEQVKTLQESKAYLFEDEKSPRLVTGGNNSQVVTGDAFELALMKGAGLSAEK